MMDSPPVVDVRRKRWPPALACILGLVLCAAAGAFWQHVHTRADRAVRASATAIREHNDLERQVSTAKARLAVVDDSIDAERRELAVTGQLEALEANHTKLRNDLEQQLSFNERLISSLPDPNVGPYNALVNQANAASKTMIADAKVEDSLGRQLRHQNCSTCTAALVDPA